MCVEESMHGGILQVEEWRSCMHPNPVMKPTNLFDCPKWIAMEWSQVDWRTCHFNLVSDFNIICSVASTVLGNMVDAEVVCEHGSYSLRAEDS